MGLLSSVVGVFVCCPAAHASSFLTFSFSPLSSFLLPRRSMLFLAGDLAQWQLPVGMKDLHLFDTEAKGKAQLLRVTVRRKHNPEHYLNRFLRCRSTSFIPYFLLPSVHPSFFTLLLPSFYKTFPGDITQINLPVGMQSVNFRCTGLTGKAAS